MGELSNSEIFFAWRHAKQTPHIPVPDDDPVPIKAIWWIASHHTLIPDKFIPTSFDDDLRLPSSTFNEVLSVIAEEYGVDSGRLPRNEN